MKSILRPRSFGMIVIALILSASIYGFAAANTVPDHYAGDGTGAISGYVISNIVYDLGADPSTINGVDFDLDAAASEVHVTLNGGSWTSCGISGLNISCTGLSQSVATYTALRVVAAD